MYVVIPHVGKSHLTYRLVQSIPDEHPIVLVDGSYVQDMGTLAFNRQSQIDYVPTGVPHCLAKNWNLGAARVPKSEPYWIFCATDIEFHPGAWNHIAKEEKCYPDCGIIKHEPLNWNVWLVRRWAWNLLRPMDEGYVPCAGEDDDLHMKCHASGIKIRAGDFRIVTLEGGHGSRLDIHRPGLNSDRAIRPVVVGHFERKWGLLPSTRHDPRYTQIKKEIYVRGRRRDAPPKPDEYVIPTKRGSYGALPPSWPDPLRLNLGCGRRKLDGFLNVDCDEQVRPDYVLDLGMDPWPWDEGSVDRIESYHLIEHLAAAEGRRLIEESHRVLRSGGRIAVECPDLRAAIDRWSGNGECVRHLKHVFGNQTSPWQFHKWGYTRETLSRLMRQSGLRVKSAGDGTDYHQESEPCIRVEAVKP